MSYKLDDEEASVPVPTEVLDVEEVGTEGDAALGVVEAVSAPVVELPDFGEVDAVDEGDAAAPFEGGMLDAALLDVCAVVVDVVPDRGQRRRRRDRRTVLRPADALAHRLANRQEQ